jgi:hypothetical protein
MPTDKYEDVLISIICNKKETLETTQMSINEKMDK